MPPQPFFVSRTFVPKFFADAIYYKLLSNANFAKQFIGHQGKDASFRLADATPNTHTAPEVAILQRKIGKKITPILGFIVDIQTLPQGDWPTASTTKLGVSEEPN